MTNQELAGRTALITGAGAGIGAATAQQLSDLGARIVLVDRDADAMRRVAAELPDASCLELDLDDVAAVDAVLTDPVFDLVDILVNNAGLTRVERFPVSTRETWDRMWRVNLRAPMALSQRVLAGMTERMWGRLIFVATDSARAGGGGECAYSATKAGLLGFAKSLARETARNGITSNIVCPGLIDTAMLSTVADKNPDFMDKLRSTIPMRRVGAADEIAATIAFLATPLAGYTTGQTLSVNGGIVMN